MILNSIYKKLFLISVVMFLVITFFVCCFPVVTYIDIEIIKFLQKFFSFVPLDVVNNISNFHNWIIAPVIVSVVLFLVYKKDFGLALIYVIYDYSSYEIVSFIKQIFMRHRPPFELQPLYHMDSYSFPSGHSYTAMIFLGLLIYIFFKYINNKKLKYTFSVLSGVMIILIGLSRLLLGVHYPTDVLAGFLLGLSFIFIVCIIDKEVNKNEY